jgi:hypothetical protein
VRLDGRRRTQVDSFPDAHRAVGELDPCWAHLDRGRRLAHPWERPDVVAAAPAEQDLGELAGAVDVEHERPGRARRGRRRGTRASRASAARRRRTSTSSRRRCRTGRRRPRHRGRSASSGRRSRCRASTAAGDSVDPGARADGVAVARLQVAAGDAEAHRTVQTAVASSASATGADARAPTAVTFSHPDRAELVNLQDVGGQAKPYRVRPVLRLIERYVTPRFGLPRTLDLLRTCQPVNCDPGDSADNIAVRMDCQSPSPDAAAGYELAYEMVPAPCLNSKQLSTASGLRGRIAGAAATRESLAGVVHAEGLELPPGRRTDGRGA